MPARRVGYAPRLYKTLRNSHFLLANTPLLEYSAVTMKPQGNSSLPLQRQVAVPGAGVPACERRGARGEDVSGESATYRLGGRLWGRKSKFLSVLWQTADDRGHLQRRLRRFSSPIVFAV